MTHSTTLEHMQNLSTHCLLCKKKKNKKKIIKCSAVQKKFSQVILNDNKPEACYEI